MADLKKYLSPLLSGLRNPVICFYLIILLITWLEFFLFVQEVGGMGHKLVITAFKCFGDIAMIYIFYWFLPRRFKWITLIVQSLLSIFFVLNLWYFRFWGNMLSPLSYKLTGNLNSQLFESIVAVYAPIDLIFPLAIALSISSYFLLLFRAGRPKISKHTGRDILVPVSLTLVLYAVTICAHIVSSYRQDYDEYSDKLSRNAAWYLKDIFNFKDSDARLNKLKHSGMTVHFLMGTTQIVKDIATNGGHIKLSEKDCLDIESFIYSLQDKDTEYDNIFSSNREKNLILIIVESLNGYVIEKSINGQEITPTMNALIESEGTVSNINMREQIKGGCSNDGQLIINTGLLPVDNGVTSLLFGRSNIFPSLPRILSSHQPVAIFADMGDTWDQTETFESFGFKSIYSENNFKENAERIGNDGAMFEFSKSIIGDLHRPFLLEFLTISSHVPFTDNGVEIPAWLTNDKSLDQTERNYYAMIHYFDKQLALFIDYLKESDLWDNSILIVTSDHNHELALNTEEFEAIGKYKDAIPILFFATNTGVTRHLETHAAQVNVFPTILQIMDATPKTGYHGLGRSLLDPNLKSAVDSNGKVWGNADSVEIKRQHNAFRISELILRGNYFQK